MTYVSKNSPRAKTWLCHIRHPTLQQQCFSSGTSDRRLAQRIADKVQLLCEYAVAMEPLPADLRYFKANALRSKQLCKALHRFELVAIEDLQRTESLDETLVRYESALSDRGITDAQVQQQVSRARRILEDTGVDAAAEIEADAIRLWWLDRQAEGMSSRTIAYYLGALGSLYRTCNFPQNPTESVQRPRVTTRVHRRALSEDELVRLLWAAEQPLRGYGSQQSVNRKLVYQFAIETGLRRAEIGRLRRSHIGGQVIRLPGEAQKNRQALPIPMRPWMAARVSRYVMSHGDDRVFPVRDEVAGRLFRRDLGIAGIESETPEGKADFHSLRQTGSRLLLESGASDLLVNRFLRHVGTSMAQRHYSSVLLEDLERAIVNAMPDWESLGKLREKKA